jgi:hypothetical protein
MAVVLTRYKNVAVKGNEENVKRQQRKIRMKTHPKMRAHLKEIADSIEKAKSPEKVVKIKTLRNLPRNAMPETKAFLKSEPKNTNPETGRKRNWTYQKYPSILPPPHFIRKVQRVPRQTLVGTIKPKGGIE